MDETSESSALENGAGQVSGIEALWDGTEEPDAPPEENEAAPESETEEPPEMPDGTEEEEPARAGAPEPVPDGQQTQTMPPMLQNDIYDFLAAYPEVKPESIPAEVWAEVRAGKTLTHAYTMHQNRSLKAQLAAAEQNSRNRARAPGSMRSQGERGKKSIAELWDEAET